MRVAPSPCGRWPWPYLATVTYHNVRAPAGYDNDRIGVTVVAVGTD